MTLLLVINLKFSWGSIDAPSGNPWYQYAQQN